MVVLGPYMADRIAAQGRRARADRDDPGLEPARRDLPDPARRPTRCARRSAWTTAFVAMYSGNLGLAHSFDEFIEAARRLRDRADIVFLFVGGGPRLAEVKAAREREGLTNIRLLDYVPRVQLHASLSLADVHLISMRPEMTGIVVPGKLYGVMAAGRPAVFVGPEHCESADTIRDAGCGITITPGDADGLVAALLHLASEPEPRAPHGRKGTLGVPRGPRAKTLLRPLARADRRRWSLGRKPAGSDRPRRACRSALEAAAAPLVTLSQ